MEQNPISRDNFEFAIDLLRKYITINCSEEERNNSKQLLDLNYPKLNEEQKRIIDTIIDENGAYLNYCILGNAGTGKSFPIKTLMAYFRYNNISYGVTASTGIAAALINGRTLHSLFALFTKDDEIKSGLTLSDIQGQAISQMKYLFIDEVTMLSKKVFDAIDKKLNYLMIEKYGSERYSPFGGLKLILTGDMAQVPAVIRLCYNDLEEAKNMFTSLSLFNLNSFQFHILNINQRQNIEEEDFMYLLNEVRDHENGSKLSEKSLTLLKSILIEGGMTKETIDLFENFVGTDGLTVFYTNDMLDIYNEQILMKYFADKIERFDGLYIKKP